MNRRPPAVLLLPAGVVLLAVLAPWLTGGDPLQQRLPEALQGPSGAHWWGTDEFGRDVLLRALHGARASVLTALVVVALSFGAGVLLGGAAAVLPGWGRRLWSSALDVALGVPGIVVAIAIVGALGPGNRNVVVALSALGWAWYARLAHEQARELLTGPVVQAARVSGVRPVPLLAGHVLPHLVRRLLVVACLDVGFVVVAVAALGYLGLGAQQPAPDVGLMLRDGQSFVLDAPWLLLAPAAVVFVVVVPFVLAGERVHEKALRS